jgi:hypothetical protein
LSWRRRGDMTRGEDIISWDCGCKVQSLTKPGRDRPARIKIITMGYVIMAKNDPVLKIQLKSLKMLTSDFEKLLQKNIKKREKEVQKLNKKIDGLNRDELADAYGYNQISRNEYQIALKRLDETENQNQAAIDEATPITEYIRILRQNINDLKLEVFEIEEELGIKHLTLNERKKMLGLGVDTK